MLGAPQAMARSEAPEGPLTRDELRQRTIQRLHEIEAVGAALRDHSSSHEVCRARGFLVGSEGFARCWIAVEETAQIRAKAIAKADALAAVVRALLNKHTTSPIKPTASGVSFESSRCYDPQTRRLIACHNI